MMMKMLGVSVCEENRVRMNEGLGEWVIVCRWLEVQFPKCLPLSPPFLPPPCSRCSTPFALGLASGLVSRVSRFASSGHLLAGVAPESALQPGFASVVHHLHCLPLSCYHDSYGRCRSQPQSFGQALPAQSGEELGAGGVPQDARTTGGKPTAPETSRSARREAGCGGDRGIHSWLAA